jgi:hypothetical protein
MIFTITTKLATITTRQKRAQIKVVAHLPDSLELSFPSPLFPSSQMDITVNHHQPGSPQEVHGSVSTYE